MPRSAADVPEPTSFAYANVDESLDIICNDLPDESILAVTFSPELFIAVMASEIVVAELRLIVPEAAPFTTVIEVRLSPLPSFKSDSGVDVVRFGERLSPSMLSGLLASIPRSLAVLPLPTSSMVRFCVAILLSSVMRIPFPALFIDAVTLTPLLFEMAFITSEIVDKPERLMVDEFPPLSVIFIDPSDTPLPLFNEDRSVFPFISGPRSAASRVEPSSVTPIFFPVSISICASFLSPKYIAPDVNGAVFVFCPANIYLPPIDAFPSKVTCDIRLSTSFAYVLLVSAVAGAPA